MCQKDDIETRGTLTIVRSRGMLDSGHVYSPVPIRRGGGQIIFLESGFLKSRKMGWIIKGGKILNSRSKDIFIVYAAYRHRYTS